MGLGKGGDGPAHDHTGSSHPLSPTHHLVLGLSLLGLLLVLTNVVVAELVGLLVRGNDVQPVTELVLLEELFGQVLEVALGEDGRVSGDENLLAAGVAGNLDGRSELASLAVHLEPVVEKVLKGGRVKDGIADGAAAVNDKLAFPRLSGRSASLAGPQGALVTMDGARRRYLGGSHSVPRKLFWLRPGSCAPDKPAKHDIRPITAGGAFKMIACMNGQRELLPRPRRRSFAWVAQ